MKSKDKEKGIEGALRRSVVLASFMLLLLWSPAAGTSDFSIPGSGGYPYFDEAGEFHIIYIDASGGLSLATIQEEGRLEKASTRQIRSASAIQSLQVEKDRAGKVWLVWEERRAARTHIYLAQLEDKRLVHPLHVSRGRKGFNLSPQLNISSSGESWLTWINYSDKIYRVLVKNLDLDQTWVIDQAFSANCPQIIIDGENRPWVFWVGPHRNRDEILYSRFDGISWTSPSSLNDRSDVPHVTPSVGLDFNGYPHVVWSAYDDHDYKLYYSRWDGKAWIEEQRITDGRSSSDLFPSLSLLMGTIPAVAWLRSNQGKRQIYVTCRMGEEWNPGLPVSEDLGDATQPILISSGGTLGVLWQAGKEIKSSLISIQNLPEGFYTEEGYTQHVRLQALDRDKHVGFGDSITEGVIEFEAVPEKGYIPRLEKLLDENLVDSRVINRGIGGEKTAEGLSRIDGVIQADQAENIYLMEGTNDIKDMSISVDTMAFNLREMARKARDFGMTIFLASVIPQDPWESIIKERTEELNTKIKNIASSLKVHFVDQFEAFGGVHSGFLLYSDSTHPNEAGYQLLAETFYDAFATTVPYIKIDTESLLFKVEIGEPLPGGQTFQVKNSGGGTLFYQIDASASWIVLTPSSGTSTGEWDDITVSVDASNLSQGAYQGEVTISSDYAFGNPQMITVDLSISSPIIEVDKTSLAFEASFAGDNPSAQTLRIRNSGDGMLNYQLGSEEDWISVSPLNGSSTGEWDEVQISVDISSLLRGVYQGEISITAENTPNSPFVIAVELTILGPHIQTDTPSFSFEGVRGGPNPKPQVFKVRNAGEGTLNYNIVTTKTWIQVSPASGSSTGEWDRIKVSVDISSLSAGTYEGKVRIQGEKASNSPRVLNVSVVILSPTIKLNKTSLDFLATAGGANPPVKLFKVKNTGAGTLNYQITANRSWINITPTSGTSTGEWDQIQVGVNIADLSAETNEGEVIVRDENASNSPQKLKVTLSVQLPPLFPPSNFRGEKIINRSLAQQEFINRLTWAANPENRFILRYRLYLIENDRTIFLTEVEVQTREYLHRRVEKDKVYRYGLTAVDQYGRESEPAFVDVG